jgi:ribosome recycling factor
MVKFCVVFSSCFYIENMSSLQADLDLAVSHLDIELKKLQIGRASTGFVEDLIVDAYGSSQPMKAVATITTPDASTIMIQPWDRSLLLPVEQAITSSDIGLQPNNDGHVIRLNIPAPTEERRKELSKVVHQKGEEAKISVRHARHSALDGLKQRKESKEISEDVFSMEEKELQKLVDTCNKSIEHRVKSREAEIMTV